MHIQTQISRVYGITTGIHAYTNTNQQSLWHYNWYTCLYKHKLVEFIALQLVYMPIQTQISRVYGITTGIHAYTNTNQQSLWHCNWYTCIYKHKLVEFIALQLVYMHIQTQISRVYGITTGIHAYTNTNQQSLWHYNWYTCIYKHKLVEFMALQLVYMHIQTQISRVYGITTGIHAYTNTNQQSLWHYNWYTCIYKHKLVEFMALQLVYMHIQTQISRVYGIATGIHAYTNTNQQSLWHYNWYTCIYKHKLVEFMHYNWYTCIYKHKLVDSIATGIHAYTNIQQSLWHCNWYTCLYKHKLVEFIHYTTGNGITTGIHAYTNTNQPIQTQISRVYGIATGIHAYTNTNQQSLQHCNWYTCIYKHKLVEFMALQLVYMHIQTQISRVYGITTGIHAYTNTNQQSLWHYNWYTCIYKHKLVEFMALQLVYMHIQTQISRVYGITTGIHAYTNTNQQSLQHCNWYTCLYKHKLVEFMALQLVYMPIQTQISRVYSITTGIHAYTNTNQQSLWHYNWYTCIYKHKLVEFMALQLVYMHIQTQISRVYGIATGIHAYTNTNQQSLWHYTCIQTVEFIHYNWYTTNTNQQSLWHCNWYTCIYKHKLVEFMALQLVYMHIQTQISRVYGITTGIHAYTNTNQQSLWHYNWYTCLYKHKLVEFIALYTGIHAYTNTNQQSLWHYNWYTCIYKHKLVEFMALQLVYMPIQTQISRVYSIATGIHAYTNTNQQSLQHCNWYTCLYKHKLVEFMALQLVYMHIQTQISRVYSIATGIHAYTNTNQQSLWHCNWYTCIYKHKLVEFMALQLVYMPIQTQISRVYGIATGIHAYTNTNQQSLWHYNWYTCIYKHKLVEFMALQLVYMHIQTQISRVYGIATGIHAYTNTNQQSLWHCNWYTCIYKHKLVEFMALQLVYMHIQTQISRVYGITTGIHAYTNTNQQSLWHCNWYTCIYKHKLVEFMHTNTNQQSLQHYNWYTCIYKHKLVEFIGITTGIHAVYKHKLVYMIQTQISLWHYNWYTCIYKHKLVEFMALQLVYMPIQTQISRVYGITTGIQLVYMHCIYKHKLVEFMALQLVYMHIQTQISRVYGIATGIHAYTNTNQQSLWHYNWYTCIYKHKLVEFMALQLVYMPIQTQISRVYSIATGIHAYTNTNQQSLQHCNWYTCLYKHKLVEFIALQLVYMHIQTQISRVYGITTGIHAYTNTNQQSLWHYNWYTCIYKHKLVEFMALQLVYMHIQTQISRV